jgi:hypothetical protein
LDKLDLLWAKVEKSEIECIYSVYGIRVGGIEGIFCFDSEKKSNFANLSVDAVVW